MGDHFASDPTRGMERALEEFSNLEGPALDRVTLTPQEERAAGLDARREYLERARAAGYRVSDRRDRLEYVESLVHRIAGRMRNRQRYPRIEVTLLESPVPDGQAFPGGFLIFTTALFDEPDEAAVAGVVAHELAHLDRGHMHDVARRSKLARQGFRPGETASFDEMFTRQAAVLGMMMRPFRPEQETEADCTAATWLYLEGYDPVGLVGFFERLHRRKRDEPGPNVPFFGLARTHPYSLERRDHVLARARQLQRWKPRRDLGEFPQNLKQLTPGVGVRALP